MLDVAPSLATGRNRLCEVTMAVPMGIEARVVTFGGLKLSATSFRVAAVAPGDIPACFIRCQNSFCVTNAILLHRLQKMPFIFRGRRTTLDLFIFILHRRRSTGDL